MHCLASIIGFLEKRSARDERSAITSEQIYQGIHHEQDKQTVYQTLHQFCVKNTVLKRVKLVDDTTFKYFYEPGTPLPSKVADDMLFAAQRRAEKATEQTQPPSASVTTFPVNRVIHVPAVADPQTITEVPMPRTEQTTPIPTPIPIPANDPRVNHYAEVIKDLQGIRHKLEQEMTQVDTAIAALRILKPSLSA